MMLFTIIFLSLILTLNTILWWFYRRSLGHDVETAKIKLNGAYAYIDELQRRCELLRTARNTEMLAAKTMTKPVVRYFPIQRQHVTWLIEQHLN